MSENLYFKDELENFNDLLVTLRYKDSNMEEYEKKGNEFLEKYGNMTCEVLSFKKTFDGLRFVYPALCEFIAERTYVYFRPFGELVSVLFEDNRFNDDLLFQRACDFAPSARPLVETIMKRKFDYFSDDAMYRVIKIAEKIPGSVAYEKFYEAMKQKYRNVHYQITDIPGDLAKNVEITEIDKSIKEDINLILFSGCDMENDKEDLRYILLRYQKDRIIDLGFWVYKELIYSFFNNEGEYALFVDEHLQKIGDMLKDKYDIEIDFISDLVKERDKILDIISNKHLKYFFDDMQYVNFLVDLVLIRQIDYSVTNY